MSTRVLVGLFPPLAGKWKRASALQKKNGRLGLRRPFCCGVNGAYQGAPILTMPLPVGMPVAGLMMGRMTVGSLMVSVSL